MHSGIPVMIKMVTTSFLLVAERPFLAKLFVLEIAKRRSICNEFDPLTKHVKHDPKPWLKLFKHHVTYSNMRNVHNILCM